MVIVQLLGGLGNQMFQYALGKSLAVSNNSELKVDTSVLLDHRPGVHAVNRNYELDIFRLHVERASPWDIWRYNTHSLSIPGKIAGRLYKLVAGDSTIRERHFHFDETIPALKGDIYLTGTWQSYRYLFAEKEIRSDFQFRHRLEGTSASIADEIDHVQSVCLHVRRTDYITVKNSKDTLGFIGIDYYKKAIAHLSSLHSGLHYFIFSDDMEWCRQHLEFIKAPVTFVSNQYAGAKPAVDLDLMTRCKYFIIPNSTFSWWAAWLSSRIDKTVISPQKWMNDLMLDTKDLIPAEWQRL
jgi:hypothetical protein